MVRSLPLGEGTLDTGGRAQIVFRTGKIKRPRYRNTACMEGKTLSSGIAPNMAPALQIPDRHNAHLAISGV